MEQTYYQRYREKNKEKIRQYNENWRKNNPDKIKNYYLQNKEKYNSKAIKIKLNCVCCNNIGFRCKREFSRHLKTKKHLKNILSIN